MTTTRTAGPSTAPDYATQKATLKAGDAAARRALAEDTDTRPEVLFFLAEDPETAVRKALAANPGTPVHAQLVLAQDAETSVREAMARRAQHLSDALSSDGPVKHRDVGLQVLETLARDQLPAIRMLVAEALAEVTGRAAPEVKSMVKRLALDDVLEVAAVTLERSRLLDDADLIELMETGVVEGGLSAVARRPGLTAVVAKEVIARGDDQAIAALLGNHSAQVREEMLDEILDRAPGVEEWHEPLVHRPGLSPRSAKRIAGFVAASLLEVLHRREDLDRATIDAVAEVVRSRVDEGPQEEEERTETPLEHAQRLHAAGELTHEAVSEAIGRNDRAFVNAALAVLGGLHVDIVRDMIASRSGKAVVALAWKAGLSMREATQMQSRIAGIAPTGIVRPRGGGEFPMTPEDMEWQIEFFGG